jgi:hypothetical protein
MSAPQPIQPSQPARTAPPPRPTASADRASAAQHSNAPRQAAAPDSSADTLELSLVEHGIGFVLPPGSTLSSAKLDLPHGAIISGTFRGDITCESGSVIIPRGGVVVGSITADCVYIEGSIGSRGTASDGGRSVVTGRLLIAASSHARINADLQSRAFAMHQPQLWGRFLTIVDGPARLE